MSFSKSFSGRNLARPPSVHIAMEALKEISNIPSAQLLFEKLLVPPVRKSSVSKDNKFWKPDNQSLKLQIHNLKISNNRLQQLVIANKIQIQAHINQVKRLRKYQKHYQNQLKDQKLTNTNLKKQIGSETIATQLIRKKHMKLKLQLSECKKEIQKLKRIPQSNILREYEIEKQLLVQETIRLKAYIKGQMFQKQEIEMTQQVIRSLKEELEKQKGAVRLLQSQNKTVKAKNKILKKSNRHLTQEALKYGQQLRAKEVEIASLSHQNQNLMMKRFNQFKVDQQTRQKEQINNLQGRVRIFEDVQRQLEIHNASLKQELTNLKQKQKQRDEVAALKQDQHASQIRLYRQKLYDLQEKLKYFLQSKPLPVKRVKTSQIYAQKQKLIKPVKITELDYERVLLKNVMRKYHLKGKDIIINQSYSIQQLSDTLKNEPMKCNQTSALLIARYIIEDDGLESVGIDMTITQKSTILISRLQHLANGYDLYDQEQQNILQRQWRNIVMTKMQQFGRKINEALKYSKSIRMPDIGRLIDINYSNNKLWAYLQTQIFDPSINKNQYSLKMFLKFIQRVGGQLKRSIQTQTDQ